MTVKVEGRCCTISKGVPKKKARNIICKKRFVIQVLGFKDITMQNTPSGHRRGREHSSWQVKGVSAIYDVPVVRPSISTSTHSKRRKAVDTWRAVASTLPLILMHVKPKSLLQAPAITIHVPGRRP